MQHTPAIIENQAERAFTVAEPAILKWVVSRDDIDHDAILRTIETSNHLSNWQMGYIDAHDGAPFAPEMYFAHTEQMIEYANGYLTASPANEIARLFVSSREKPAPQLELFVVGQPLEIPYWIDDAMYQDEQLQAALDEKDAKPGLDAQVWFEDDYDDAYTRSDYYADVVPAGIITC